MNKELKLRKLIRKKIKETIKEISNSASLPGFNSAFAFAKDDSRMRNYLSKNGYEVVDKEKAKADGKGKGSRMKTPSGVITFMNFANTLIGEASYKSYKSDDSLSNKKKINIAINKINSKLFEIEKIMNQNIKLKTEYKMDSDSYWKTTKNNLHKIQNKLNKLSNKIKELS